MLAIKLQCNRVTSSEVTNFYAVFTMHPVFGQYSFFPPTYLKEYTS